MMLHLWWVREYVPLAVAHLHVYGGLCTLNWINTEQITEVPLPKPRSRGISPKSGITGKSDLWIF